MYTYRLISSRERTMKREYDFSNAQRGTFFKPGATLRLPIDLDSKVQNDVKTLANQTGQNIGVLVNRIVKKGLRQARRS